MLRSNASNQGGGWTAPKPPGDLAKEVRSLRAEVAALAVSVRKLTERVGLSNTPTRDLLVSRIIAICAKEWNVSENDIRSLRRDVKAVRPRQAACWFARHYTLQSLPQIARALNRADHTTVMHAIARCDQLRQASAEYRKTFEAVRAAIEAEIEKMD